MANSLYDSARELFLTGQLSVSTGTVKAALVKSTYSPSLTTHNFYDDVSAEVVGTPQTLTGITTTGGVFDAGDATFATVPSGSTVNYVLIYKDTGDPATSPVIALIDSGTGIPGLATNNGDIVITWDNGANKIFKL